MARTALQSSKLGRLVLIGAMVATPVSALAQGTGAPPTDPHRYPLPTYEEDWRALQGVDRTDVWDPEKFVPLSADGTTSTELLEGETLLKTCCPGEVSFRVRDAHGNYRWFLSRTEPLRGHDGTLLYWIGINLDIEERRKAEFYLAEGQRLAHTGSWMFNAGGFEYWSSELFAIHGLDPDRKAPTVPEYMALVQPVDREFVAQAIQTILAEHRGFDFTKRIVRPDGSIRHVRCVGTPATSGGIFQGFVGTGIDVTEHEELTKALRKSEAELRQTLDFAPQLIAVFGPNGERLYANRRALEYVGVSLDEWRGREASALRCTLTMSSGSKRRQSRRCRMAYPTSWNCRCGAAMETTAGSRSLPRGARRRRPDHPLC